MKKFLSVLTSLFIIFSAVAPISAVADTLSDDIVILYTNDVHTYIDGPLSYDVISAVKKDLQKQYKYVFLADAGDHIQGTAYGSIDKGENIIKMMNMAKYDIATLGNHEFDYGMDGCLNAVRLADFPYVSANFYRQDNGSRSENVLDSLAMFDCGKEKLAMIGITTPETFEKSTTAYFQDENGNFIYGISGGNDGSELQKDVQAAIDEAKRQGATQIVALGHLGVDPSSQPWTSKETISAVCGLDAFIDGHSHSTVKSEVVKDKDGHDVILTQTGSYLDRIGIMAIDSKTDKITTDFIECEEILDTDGKTVIDYKLLSDTYNGTELIYDDSVREIKDNWISEIDRKLGEKIGSTDVVLDNYDKDGNRLVRSAETNSGDFAADALYYLFDNMGMDVDVAIMNGGGIRNVAITGDISYKLCKDMHTFGNIACLQRVSGKQILDALEWGARKLGTGENGGFLQVSGITYKIDSDILNTVKEDEIGTWIAGPDEYRVYDVKVYNKKTGTYEALDINSEYKLAGYNYTLRNLGDGYAMFLGAENILDYVMEDYMVLANYVKGFENGVIGATNSPLKLKYPNILLNYGTVYGSGRIKKASKANSSSLDEIVSVGGIRVTSENMDDVLNDGGSVKYDPETDTLTLTDATITNADGHGIYAYGINLTINGIDTEKDGSNAISGASSLESGLDEDGNEYTVQNHGCGIYVEGDGYGTNGGLTVRGSVGNIESNGGNGIFAYGDIKIKGSLGSIECTGSQSCGIVSDFGNIILEKAAAMGDVTSADYSAISCGKDVIISGKAADIKGCGNVGIHCVGGDVIIDGSVQDIFGNSCGIEAYSADEIGGSIAISGKIGEIGGAAVGIYTDGYLNISGIAKVSATDTTDPYSLAISAGKDIILPTQYEIVTNPDEYKINALHIDDSLRYTISDSSEKPVCSVTFSGFANPYDDVAVSDWFYNNIAYATVNGLFNGTSESIFEPNGNLTRAMLVTVLYRSENEPPVNKSVPFADVSQSEYYGNAVVWAKQNGIVFGISDNEFSPNTSITREDIAVIIFRYAQYKGISPSASSEKILDYTDFKAVSDYAVDGMSYCVSSGIIDGKSEVTLNPKEYATRAELAAILQRFAESNK